MSKRLGSFITRLAQTPALPERELIARSLEHLLNTRKGCGSVNAQLGLGDYEAAVTTHEAVLLLRTELEQLALGYEPRLSAAKVVLLGRHGYSKIRFELRGSVGEVAERYWIDVDTTTHALVVALVEARA